MVRSKGDWQPAELLIDIFLKLHVKTIIRFKCVAKTWCHLFQDHNFISQHHNISKKNKQLLAFYYLGIPRYLDFVMRLFVDLALVSFQDMFQTWPIYLDGISGVNIFVENGLLCLCDCINSRLTLCNPATKEFRMLPECNENNPPKANILSHNIGFGLDPLSNDVKVIYIRSYLDEEVYMHVNHYAIYKMSTDSWRVLKHEDIPYSEYQNVRENVSNAYVNGVYYWKTDRQILVFYFDIEAFQLIESPCPKLYGRLIPLNDHISFWNIEMMHNFDKDNDVWVLNDEGHWTKLLKFEPNLQVVSMYGFWRNGKVLAQSITGQLLLYDYETEDFSETKIKVRAVCDYLQMFTYEENLVMIRRE